MRKLLVVDDSDEADRICALLEDKGIPVSRVWSTAWSGMSSPRPYYQTLYVCLDSQFADAKTILKCPSHDPSEPVNVREYHEYVQAAGDGSVLAYILKPALIIGLVCLALIYAVYKLTVHH